MQIRAVFFKIKRKNSLTPTLSNSKKFRHRARKVSFSNHCKFVDYIFEKFCLQMIAETDLYWLLANPSAR